MCCHEPCKFELTFWSFKLLQTIAKEVILLGKSNYSGRSGCFVKVGERLFAVVVVVVVAAVVATVVVVIVRKVFESLIIIADAVSTVAAVAFADYH